MGCVTREEVECKSCGRIIRARFPKRAILALVVSISILFALMFLITSNTIINVSAVEAHGLGAYWDINCTDRVFSINWGILTPVSVNNTIIYIRNEVEESRYLILETTNWSPSEASQYLNLGWDYAGQWINPGEALQITLTLAVSQYVEGILSFNFDIIITGNWRARAHYDDFAVLAGAYGYSRGHPAYNPEADFDLDGDVDNDDFLILAGNYG